MTKAAPITIAKREGGGRRGGGGGGEGLWPLAAETVVRFENYRERHSKLETNDRIPDASCENFVWAFRCSQLRDNPKLLDDSKETLIPAIRALKGNRAYYIGIAIPRTMQ